MYRLLIIDPSPEILSLQHLLQRHTAIQANDVFERHRSKPVTIADGFGARRIQNLEWLLTVTWGIRHDFLMGQLRPRGRMDGGVANYGSEVTNDYTRLVCLIMELHYCMVNVVWTE